MSGLVTVYPPLEPAAALRRPAAPAFPFDHPGTALTHLGRGAAWLALKALGLGPGTRIAMPAYHCGSEVEAARLAGCDVRFYRLGPDLAVDAEDLERKARKADAVYLISNFGFPMPAAPADVLVIEDAAHGLLSAAPDGVPLGGHGDAAVFCPRKSLGVPDGGAVLVRRGAPPRPAGRPPWQPMARSALSLAATRAALASAAPVRDAATRLIAGASRGDAAAREGTLTETVIGEWDLEVADMEAAAAGPSRLTELLVARADPAELAERRRSHYTVLAAELADHTLAPFRSLPDGTVPLYFPLLVPDRPAAMRMLLEHGVRALEVWPVPHPLLRREKHPELEAARRGLVALPVHQSLRPEHLAMVLGAAKAALA